jgi:hypothetical protein
MAKFQNKSFEDNSNGELKLHKLDKNLYSKYFQPC